MIVAIDQVEHDRAEKNLKRFEEMEFEAWNRRAWDHFDEMHAEAYFETLHGLLQIMPDARIDSHPIKIGQGDWTIVVVIISGTLPNGKKFTGQICSLMRWKDERVVEEHTSLGTQAL